MQISQLWLNYNKKMKLLDFYIGSTFLKCFLLVILILAVLFSFIEFLSQLDDVGTGRYGLGNAALYVVFTLPRCLIDLMPVSAMLGGVITLGLLADRGELVAMQAAGISTPRDLHGGLRRPSCSSSSSSGSWPKRSSRRWNRWHADPVRRHSTARALT